MDPNENKFKEYINYGGKELMKKLRIFILAVLFSFLVIGCIEIEDIETIEFGTIPKAIYVVGEQPEVFTLTVIYKESVNRDDEILYSNDSRVTVTGFDTSTTGTKTMVVTVDGLDNASISFSYTVVSTMLDLLFAGGKGTETEPYEIANAQHLSNIRLALDKHYILVDDVDLDGMPWNPIGEVAISIDYEQSKMTTLVVKGFSGVLDGDGHSIKNLTIIEDWYVGLVPSSLFAAINGDSPTARAEVKNLKMEDVNIDTQLYASGLTYSSTNATFTDIEVTGYMSARSLAGLVGEVKGDNSFIRVKNYATLFINPDGEGNENLVWRTVGGIAVKTYGNGDLLFQECENHGDIIHGDITDDTEWQGQNTLAGQMVGMLHDGNLMILENCKAYGTIYGYIKVPDDYWGAFYGYNKGDLSEGEGLFGVYKEGQNVKGIGGHRVTPFDTIPECRKLIGGVMLRGKLGSPASKIRIIDDSISYNEIFHNERNDQTVTFEDYDSTVLETQTVENSFFATPPTTPTREGYTFSHWYRIVKVDEVNTEDEITDFLTYSITGDFTFYAKYTQDET